jgi:proteasome accessory factor B
MPPRSARTTTSESRPDERILQLLLFLIGSARPVTRAEIFAAIRSYKTSNAAAGLRKFERDKKELRELGVPITETDDLSDAYRIERRAYELPPLSLTEDERAALALAAGAIDNRSGLAYRELLEEALRKLSYASGLTGPAKAPSQVLVSLSSRTQGKPMRKHLATLTTAVETQKRVTLIYADITGSRAERSVDPYALAYTAGDWQLVGFCHLRKAPRTFRIDRIVRLKVAPKPGTPDFVRPESWNLQSYVQRSPWLFKNGNEPVMKVVIDIGPERVWMVQEDFGPEATRSKPDSEGWIQVSFQSGNQQYIVTRVLDACGQLRIVSPKSLRERVRDDAAAIFSRYAAGQNHA